MELNERKIRILEYIINDYIQTAEPVGSRTIAKNVDLGLSSATIRNEMSDLEEMGYILAPHASAGRVPSDFGYRFFVDRLLKKNTRQRAVSDISPDAARFLSDVVTRNINQLDYLMQETAKAISLLTNYTAVVSEAVSTAEKIGRLQLMPLDESSILLITVTSSKKVKNHSIRTQHPPDYETLITLSRSLNAELIDKSPQALSSGAKKRLLDTFAGNESLLTTVLSIISAVLDDGSERQVYTGGIKNILAFPEFNDNIKARALFDALEERAYLISLLDEDGIDVVAPPLNGVSVVIGRENSMLELKNCSIVKTVYTLGDGSEMSGGIAIIGPTRMDYQQAVAVLRSVARQIRSVVPDGKD